MKRLVDSGIIDDFVNLVRLKAYNPKVYVVEYVHVPDDYATAIISDADQAVLDHLPSDVELVIMPMDSD